MVLHQIPHPRFQREGPHLYIKKEIALVEALCGGEFLIQHLDGRILKFSTRPGEVLAPYQIKCVPNQGMPYKHTIHRKGHIFVQFEVKFPPQPCNPHMCNVLKRFLPPAPPDPLANILKQQPNRLQQCEIVDLAFPQPQPQQQRQAPIQMNLSQQQRQPMNHSQPQRQPMSHSRSQRQTMNQSQSQRHYNNHNNHNNSNHNNR